MTLLHQQIKAALLPVLLANTQAARGKPKTADTDPKEVALQAAFNSARGTLNSSVITHLASMFNALTGFNIIVAGGERNGAAVMSVIVFNEHYAPSYVESGSPYINVHQRNRFVLDDRGNTSYDEYTSDVDGWRYATDEEVEQCVNELNTVQLRMILRDSVFAPYLQSMFEDTADEPETEDKDEDEPLF